MTVTGPRSGLKRDGALSVATASSKSRGERTLCVATLRINWPFLIPAAAAGDPSSTSVTTTPGIAGSSESRTEGAEVERAGVVDAQAAPRLGAIGGDDFPVDGVLGQDDRALDRFAAAADLEPDGVAGGIGVDREDQANRNRRRACR